MNIDIKYNNKEEWNKLVIQNSHPASFLHSFEWGEFNQKILGLDIQRWGVIDSGSLMIVIMIIKKNLPLGRFYYYCPRGGIYKQEYADRRANAYGKIIKKYDELLKDGVFLRVCPPYEFKDYLFNFLQRLKLTKPKILTHTKEPGKTLILDLAKSEEELLKGMHHKTRYNIRLAGKKGVRVREMNKVTQKEDIQIFYKLSEETSKRDKINIYNKEYYNNLINYFTHNNGDVKLRLFVAEKDSTPLSAAIVLEFGDTATYLHGASSNVSRNLMPNYLMQWEAIKKAKKNGMKIYDFWGISEKNKDWAGITRFKKGFGGETITFLGSWDYILNKKWYSMLYILKLFKKLIHIT